MLFYLTRGIESKLFTILSNQFFVPLFSLSRNRAKQCMKLTNTLYKFVYLAREDTEDRSSKMLSRSRLLDRLGLLDLDLLARFDFDRFLDLDRSVELDRCLRRFFFFFLLSLMVNSL